MTFGSGGGGGDRWQQGILPNDAPSAPAPGPAPAPAPAPDIPTITGIDPNELASVTYGKRIPIFAGGLARIGTAGIIFGPYVESGRASFAVSFGFPANVSGTRKIYEIALDSKLAWQDAAGISGPTAPSSGFLSEVFTFRFYQGTLTQTVDSLETAKFPGEEIAYRPQMVIFFENLPLAPFNNKIPFVAAVIGDTTAGANPADGINLGEAIERIAYSPWVGMTSDDFDTTGITDLVGAVIVAESTSFLDFIKNISRIYRTYDILQTDKLRIVDRGTDLDADFTFTRDHVVGDVIFSRAEPESVAREHELITIDEDADYTLVPAKAEHPRDPVNVSETVGKETVTLPIVTDATTRASLATYWHYAEEHARKKVQFTVSHFGLEIEPGDIFSLSGIASGIEDEHYKVIETSHNGNWTVSIVGEALLKCTLPATSGDSGGDPGSIPSGPTGAWSSSRVLITGYAGDLYNLTAGKVDTLYDQSGNVRNLTQGTAARRPSILASGPNSRNGLDFTGASNHRLLSAASLNDFINADAGYMVISFIADAFTLNNVNAAQNDWLLADSGLFAGMTIKSGGSGWSYNFDGAYDQLSTSGLVAGTPYVMEWKHDAGQILNRVNGGTWVNTASGNTTTLTNALVMGSASSSQGFDGRLFEALTYDVVPTTAEQDAIVANLKSWVGA